MVSMGRDKKRNVSLIDSAPCSSFSVSAMALR